MPNAVTPNVVKAKIVVPRALIPITSVLTIMEMRMASILLDVTGFSANVWLMDTVSK